MLLLSVVLSYSWTLVKRPATNDHNGRLTLEPRRSFPTVGVDRIGGYNLSLLARK
jgi:hypothetical protein